MVTVIRFKKYAFFEGINLQSKAAYCYVIDKRGIQKRFKLKCWITKKGKIEIGKPVEFRKEKYERTLSRLGDRINCTFTKIKEMYN